MRTCVHVHNYTDVGHVFPPLSPPMLLYKETLPMKVNLEDGQAPAGGGGTLPSVT